MRGEMGAVVKSKLGQIVDDQELWRICRTLLHAKAFGQEVFKVAFSQDDDNRLTTCGTGHIR